MSVTVILSRATFRLRMVELDRGQRGKAAYLGLRLNRAPKAGRGGQENAGARDGHALRETRGTNQA
eukprot:scaffold77468_cov33-Tisochrysis_lutea.AAC.3